MVIYIFLSPSSNVQRFVAKGGVFNTLLHVGIMKVTREESTQFVDFAVIIISIFTHTLESM